MIGFNETQPASVSLFRLSLVNLFNKWKYYSSIFICYINKILYLYFQNKKYHSCRYNKQFDSLWKIYVPPFPQCTINSLTCHTCTGTELHSEALRPLEGKLQRMGRVGFPALVLHYCNAEHKPAAPEWLMGLASWYNHNGVYLCWSTFGICIQVVEKLVHFWIRYRTTVNKG